MAASMVLLVVACFLTLAHMVSTNIILECISILYCNGNAPVCGTNGTHCWHSKSDCERAKFNCLHLYKKDFDKVDMGYCSERPIGGINECCVRKTCSGQNEQICAQITTKDLDKCRWFENKCDLQNHNCENKKETVKASCKFGFDNNEQNCTKPNGRFLKVNEKLHQMPYAQLKRQLISI